MRSFYPIVLSLLMGAIIAESNCVVYAQSGPREELRSFAPEDGEELTKGNPLTVSADVSLHPSTLEAVTFISTITINKKRYQPFTTTLTQQTESEKSAGTEVMSWATHVPGPRRISIRLQLEGVGQRSQTRLQFADITRVYQVACNPREFWLFRKIDHLLGGCT